MIKVTNKNKEDMYAKLSEHAESDNRKTRFGMLQVLEELNIELNQESVNLIEKLYADGFIDA